MIIYSIIRRRVKSATRIETTLYFFTPSHNEVIRVAKNLASRYKRKYLILLTYYDDETLNPLKEEALHFVTCSGKGCAPIITDA